MDINEKYLCRLMRSAAFNEEAGIADDGVDIKKVFELSKKQDVSNIAFRALDKVKDGINTELYAEWKKSYFKAVMLNTLQLEKYEQVKTMLKENNIRFLPLKGINMKKYYPSADLRTMSDIDLLVDGDNIVKVSELMCNAGYSQHTETGEEKHIVFSLMSCVNFEIHRRISDTDDGIFSDIWDIAITDDGIEYRLSDSDFYLYTVYHIYIHCTEEMGIGVRYLLDMLVCEKKLELDFNYIKTKLQEWDIYGFYKNLKCAVDACFCDDEITDSDFLDMVFESGAHGGVMDKASIERYIKTNFGGSKMRYVISETFPHMQEMKRLYPVLEEKPYLVGAFYAKRIALRRKQIIPRLKVIFGKKN